MRKKWQYIFIFILVIIVISCIQKSNEDTDISNFTKTDRTKPLSITDKYCHRCGMRINNNGKTHFITTQKGEIWYECCPMCILMDISESKEILKDITAFSDVSSKIIRIKLQDNKIISYQPNTAIILIGGSCAKNKFFYDINEKKDFIEQNMELLSKPVKDIHTVFSMVQKKNI